MDNVLTSQKEELHKLIQHKYSYFMVKYVPTLDIDTSIKDKLEYFFCSNGDNIIFKYNDYCVKMVVFGLNYTSLETAEMKMLNILSRLVVSKKTPHILLPLVYGYSQIGLSPLLKDINNDDNLSDIKKDLKRGAIAKKKLLIITEWCENKDLGSYINDRRRRDSDLDKDKDKDKDKDTNNDEEKDKDEQDYPDIKPDKSRKNATLSIIEWKIILFKIIYTLSVIYTNYPTFRHNDLSSKNILIGKSTSTSSTQYKFDYLVYEMPPSDIEIFLWDFEFANIKDIINNKLIVNDLTNMRKEYGISIERNQYYDIHYFLNGLYGLYKLPREIEEFILRNIDKRHLGRNISYNTNNYRLLKHVEYNTPKKMLKDALFREFIVEDKINTSCCLVTGVYENNRANKYIGN